MTATPESLSAPSRHRRLGLAAFAALITIVPALAVSTVSAEAQNQPRKLVFGAYTRPNAGETKQQAVEHVESQLGRTLGSYREFVSWDEAFPQSFHNFLKGGNRTLLLSVRTRKVNNSNVPWASIAGAQPGSARHNEIVAWADKMIAWQVPIYFTLQHEPEASSNTALGTNTEFIAAWRKVVQVFRDRGATNVKFLWIMTDYAFSVPSSDRRQAPKWFPGVDWVDGAAIDPYNWHECRPGTLNRWKSLETLVEPFRQWSLAYPSLELWLAEFASVEDKTTPDAKRKAAWLNDARALFKKPGWEKFVGINYFDAKHPTGEYPNCVWYLDTSQHTLDAAIAFANDPLYTGAVGQPAPTTTTTVAPTTTIAAGPPAPTALLVVGEGAAPASGDVTVSQRLSTLGYNVTVIDDSALTAASSADVIVVSSSVATGAMGTKLLNSTSPVVNYKPFLMPALGMTASDGVGNISGTSADIATATPLAGGLTGSVSLATSSRGFGWGTPAASAEIVANLGGKAVSFAYDTGDVLASGVAAPSCRSLVALRHDAMATVTAANWTLFEAAISHAAAC